MSEPGQPAHFVGNQWRPAAGGLQIPVIDPCYGKVFTHIARGGAADIDAAVETVTKAGGGLYGLVNNAGVATIAPITETSPQEFDLVMRGQNWREDRAWFHDESGRLRSVPANWTDLVADDAFNVVAAGRAAFRPKELFELAQLIRTIRP